MWLRWPWELVTRVGRDVKDDEGPRRAASWGRHLRGHGLPGCADSSALVGLNLCLPDVSRLCDLGLVNERL